MSRRISSDELRAKFPNASQSFLALNAEAVDARSRPSISEPDNGRALEACIRRKETGSDRPTRRLKIVFRVRSIRPADYDNYFCKKLQDLLVKSGALPDDKWSILQGEVIPEKVSSKAEEGTVIEIYELFDDASSRC